MPATLVFLAVVVLAASGLIATAASRRSGDEAWAGREQARLAAFSGVDAVVAELVNQRADLLAGDDPTLTSEWTLASGETFEWVVRVVGVASGDDGFGFPGVGRQRATGEAGRLDVRVATEEVLRAMPGLVRDGLSVSSLRAAGSELVVATRRGERIEEDVTVRARDPEIQGGVGGTSGLASEGSARIDLSAGWNDGVSRAVEERFGSEFASSLSARMRREPITSMSSFVRWVATTDRGLSDDPSAIGAFVDGVSFSGREMVDGRVDVRRASGRVLAAVLGVTDGEGVASARDALPDDDLRGIGWLVADGHIDLDRFAALADRLTYRSLQWRVRVEAGRRAVSDGASVGEIDEFGVVVDDSLDGGGLEYRVAYEAVIDVAEERARVVSMRDVTLLDLVQRFDGGGLTDGDEALPDEDSARESLLDEAGLEEAGEPMEDE